MYIYYMGPAKTFRKLYIKDKQRKKKQDIKLKVPELKKWCK